MTEAIQDNILCFVGGFLLATLIMACGYSRPKTKKTELVSTKQEDGIKPHNPKSNSINQFCVEVSKYEGKKKQVDIAQISEMVRIVNDLTKGLLYRYIRSQWVGKDDK